MTSPDPVPLPLGPLAAIVTTEGMTLSATEVTGQALAVAVDAEVTAPALDPDDSVAPTMRPPTTPPTTSADPSATHRSHRRGLRACLDSPKAALSGPLNSRRPSERTPRWRDYRTVGNSTIFNSRA